MSNVDWFLHVYLDIDPMPRSVSDLETDVIIAITEKVIGISSDTPLKTHDFRISFLNNFLRLFYINCCKQDVEDDGKRKFRLTLESIQRAIDGNKKRQQNKLDQMTSPENTDSDESDSDDSDCEVTRR